jgi:hypothetical protein
MEPVHEVLFAESAATGADAARIVTRLSRARRGDALAWWPGSPWRDPLTAPGLVWLALLEDAANARGAADASRPAKSAAKSPSIGGPTPADFAAVLERARGGRPQTLIGRALAHGFAEGGPAPDELSRALDAARAFERGGTFATRRALAERALAWSGGSAAAWTRLLARRAESFGGVRRVEFAPAGPRFANDAELVRRLEAGCSAERLARWTARPAVELAAGRLVFPLDELSRAGLAPSDMVERPDDPRWRELAANQVGFVRGLLARAWPAAGLAGPLAGRAVAAWLAGVERCLRQIEARAFAVTQRPVPPPRAPLLGALTRRVPEHLAGLG